MFRGPPHTKMSFLTQVDLSGQKSGERQAGAMSSVISDQGDKFKVIPGRETE